MHSYTAPHFARSVLVTIDTQNDFTLDRAPARIAGTKEVIPYMVRLLEAYRKNELPIVHVIRLYQRDGSNVDLCRKQLIVEGSEIAAPGTGGAELVTELKPDDTVMLDADLLLAGAMQPLGDNEYVMYKPRWGAFYATGLEAFLKQRAVDTLVFAGCNYPNCPRTSIYEASERDFRIVLARDAVSGLYPQAETELGNIGVNLLGTNEIERALT